MFDVTFQTDLARVNAALDRLLPAAHDADGVVRDAMRYSVANGGKRIRPVLVLECCRLCGGDADSAVDAACALEMIHTYSLIHDDLPCMDDDDLRRGKPACHKQFGEAIALLAGDALLTEAFRVVSTAPFAKKSPDAALRVIALLSENAGVGGMIGGQVIDLRLEGQRVTLDRLQTMDAKKTGALIRAACEIGGVIAGASEAQLSALRGYADDLGQAFQIVDDVLDVVGDEAALGKPVGSDKESEKSTYVSLLGLDAAKREAEALTARAVDRLAPFGKQAAFLRELALRLCERNA
ncbi:MAG: polyprenyl synthetase family protein [Clostridia bacterium]|nr:polyprenyl synthetase family protein [Clostridia bacterium]